MFILNVNHFGVLDVVAHEFGHGVTCSTANLKYERESGAINESYSDIWAACVENYIGGRTQEQIWQMGEDRNDIMRNLSDPNQFEQPDTYMGDFWADTSDISWQGDYGGVHTNSGVMNYWFYLLVNGGEGINDNNAQYSVCGVGFNKAMKIAYNTLTLYLPQSSTFQDVRDKSILVARNLYGNNSNAHVAVMNAWHAVGVGDPYLPVSIVGDFGVCNGGVYYVNNLPPVASIDWSTDTYTDYLGVQQVVKEKLDITDGQHTSTVAVVRSPLCNQGFDGIRQYTGEITLCATIHCNGKTTKLYKSLFANDAIDLKYKNDLTSAVRPINTYAYTFSVGVLPDYLVWTIDEPGKFTRTVSGESKVSVFGNQTGVIRVSVTDAGGCSESNTQTVNIPNGNSMTLTFKSPAYVGELIQVNAYVNEANSNEATSFATNTKTPYDSKYTLELWHSEYGFIKSVEAENSTVDLSLSNVITGNYTLRMLVDNVVVSTAQLIIR